MSDSPLESSLAALSPEKRALLLRMLQPPPEPIAIVGMACRFPGGATDPQRFWALLEAGRDAVTRVPADRWSADAYFDPDPRAPGKIGSPYGAFVDRVAEFDAAFFGISPREALRMDPQQRLFMEVAWEAIEAAGLTLQDLAGSKTGVFAGVYQSDYSWSQFADHSKVDAYVASGMSHAILANRLSYFLDLRGPSVALDTACSSSLVAMHLACESLRRKESDAAIVGGVNLMLSPLSALPISKWGMMAPDGRCKTFDARADGFVRGEGCGVLVLKRLSEARASRDPILALCLGSATNQDGRTNVLTAPNGLAQRDVIRDALARAGVAGDDIGYVEAHGTGTALGDPIEMEAIVDTVGRRRTRERPCVVGSVKTNIGHLEAAAGVAGLVKTVLVLQQRQIPPNLHFERLNPHIVLDGAGIALPDRLRAWTTRAGERRRAGVSSFGFGGTNAHVVLEEAPERDESRDATRAAPRLFALSAASAAALAQLAGDCATDVRKADDTVERLADFAWATAVRRSRLSHRLAVTGTSTAEWVAALEAHATGRPHRALVAGRKAANADRVVFVFSGQGTLWPGAGRVLLEHCDVFRDEVGRCDRALAPHLGRSVVADLRSVDGAACERTDVAQPLIFAIQMGLAALWRSWGVEPAAVVGHSLGEITAACVAGALTRDQAARIVAVRGRLMQRLEHAGRMAVVHIGRDEAERAIGSFPLVSIGAVNAPSSVVISGETTQVEALLDRWRAAGVRTQDVPVRYPFHGPQTGPLAGELSAELAGLEPIAQSLPMASSVTGEMVSGRQLDAAHWGRNLSQPVLFARAIERVGRGAPATFIELSPHAALTGDVERCLESIGQPGLVTGSLRRDTDDFDALATSLARLFVAGCAIAWKAVLPARELVGLPPYPWQRSRYWLEPPAPARAAADSATSEGHPLLGRRLRSPGLLDVVFETTIARTRPAYQQDHRIHDVLVVPATAHLEMVHAAAPRALGGGSYALEHVVVRDALIVSEDRETTLQLVFSDVRPGQAAGFRIVAATLDAPDDWKVFAHGDVVSTMTAEVPRLDVEAIRARSIEESDGAAYYARGHRLGGQLGPRFQSIERLWRGDGEALGRLRITYGDDEQGFLLHPAFADAAFHIAYAALDESDAEAGILMPIGFDHVRYHRGPTDPTWCHFQRRSAPGDQIVVGDVRMVTGSGEPVAEALGVRYRRAVTALASGRNVSSVPPSTFHIEWKQEEPVITHPRAQQRWLVVAEDAATAASLVSALRVKEQVVDAMTLPSGDDADGSVALRSRLDAWLAETRDPAIGERRVVYCATATHALDEAATAPLWNALTILQGAASEPRPARVWLVTRGAQSVDGETVDVANAMLWGVGRTAALEAPAIWGGSIDCDPASSASALDAVAADLVTPATAAIAVAWRGGRRFSARLARTENRSDGPPRFDADGAYIVTGGLGAIGGEIAHWLVRAGARHLVLVGRSGSSPDRSELLRQLEAEGASVVVRAIDVTDGEAVERLCRELSGQRPIKGVVHAAGILADASIQQLTPEHVRGVVTTKVSGAWNLHKATLDCPLDFFVLCSSAASVLGSPGQANYAAANAGLDALAQQRRAASLPAVSIAWGAWEIGMAARLGDRGRRRFDAWGLGVMTTEQALAQLPALLTSAHAQVAVLPARWSRLDPQLSRRLRELPFFANFADELARSSGAEQPSSLRADLERAPAALRKQLIADRMRAEIHRVLALPADREIDPSQGLFDLGMDSLTAIELREALEAALGRTLPATLVFDHPTLDDLSAHLAELLGLGNGDRAIAAPAPAEDPMASLSEQDLVALLARELEKPASGPLS